MPSAKPRDFARVLLPPDQAANVQRVSFNAGQWTANTTVSRIGHIFDRKSVIREVWIAADAVPSDPDGTMLVNVDVRDANEDAFDAIVANFDTEAQLTTAFEAVKAPDTNESSENELTVEAGDTIRVQLVNNSAAIGTNANVIVTILYQVMAPVGD